jgi:hypothetical protein
VENLFVEYIGSIWHELCLCVKILIVAVVLFVLLQVVELISLYINVNSGGLGTTSGKIFLWTFGGFLGYFLLLPILILICFLVSLIRIDEPINILLTVISIVIVIASFFYGRFYIRDDVLKFKPEPETLYSVDHNMDNGEALRKFGLKLNLARKDKDSAFTRQWLKQNLTGIHSEFVWNANLMNKKLSQFPDDVVVIFESDVPYDKEDIEGPNDISTWWHYGRGSLMVFGDGRVKFVKTEDFNNLRWNP